MFIETISTLIVSTRTGIVKPHEGYSRLLHNA